MAIDRTARIPQKCPFPDDEFPEAFLGLVRSVLKDGPPDVTFSVNHDEIRVDHGEKIFLLLPRKAMHRYFAFYPFDEVTDELSLRVKTDVRSRFDRLVSAVLVLVHLCFSGSAEGTSITLTGADDRDGETDRGSMSASYRDAFRVLANTLPAPCMDRLLLRQRSFAGSSRGASRA